MIVCFVVFGLSAAAQYQIAGTSVSGKKTMTTTNWQKGCVTDMNGEKKTGVIKLKIINNDTSQISWKSGDEKLKFKRLDIMSFCTSFTSAA